MKLFLFNIFFSKTLKTLEDKELIERYKESKDLELMGELFNRKLPMIASLSYKYLQNKEDAEDATYELFEVIQRDLLKHDVGNINAWLFSVTRNHCYKKLNAAKKNPIQFTDEENSLSKFMENEDEEDLLDKVTKEQKFEILESALLQLKDDQKICVEMFYLKQISYQEISDETGIELKKVKSHIQNGKRNLKIVMEEKIATSEKG